MAKIPKFKSEEEEIKFWDKHSLDEFDEDLEVAKNVKFVRPRKQVISLRLDKKDISILKEVASKMGIGHSTLARMWVKDKLTSIVSRKKAYVK